MRSIATIATHIGAALLAPAAADVIGSVAPFFAHGQGSRHLQELCVCSPRTFTFQLDFNGSCDVNTIEDNPGVSFADCNDSEKGDLTPVEITFVTIMEVGTEDFEVIRQTDIPGPLINAGTFTYTSVSNELDPNKPLGDQIISNVPGGIMMTLVGKTAAGGSVPMRLAWAYTSNCDAEPIGTGDAIGWITLVEYTSAVPAFCDAVETEPPTVAPAKSATTTPSVAPTATPSIAPIEVETESPTDSPSEVETEPPTDTPSVAPTDTPSVAPTATPVVAPTEPPSKNPTAVETEPPTARPTIASMSYSASFSLAHAKAAKGKAHKAKAGKGSKNGEPIRTRI
jgi:hypothetical protein